MPWRVRALQLLASCGGASGRVQTGASLVCARVVGDGTAVARWRAGARAPAFGRRHAGGRPDARRWYRSSVVPDLERRWPGNRSPAYGWLTVIAFQPAWVASFGQFQSPQERHWARQLAAAHVPAKCCCMHYITYTRGLGAGGRDGDMSMGDGT